MLACGIMERMQATVINKGPGSDPDPAIHRSRKNPACDARRYDEACPGLILMLSNINMEFSFILRWARVNRSRHIYVHAIMSERLTQPLFKGPAVAMW